MATGGISGSIIGSPLCSCHSLPFTSRGAPVGLNSTATSHHRRRLRFSGGSTTPLCPPLLPLQRGSRRFGRSREKAGGLAICCGGVSFADQSRFKEEVLDSDIPVLVDFVADWCGPCRLIAPIVDWVSEEYKDKLKVVKIDHDASPQLIEKYKVYGLPTLIIFKDGEEVPESRREGAVSKVKLKQFLDTFLEEKAVS